MYSRCSHVQSKAVLNQVLTPLLMLSLIHHFVAVLALCIRCAVPDILPNKRTDICTCSPMCSFIDSNKGLHTSRCGYRFYTLIMGVRAHKNEIYSMRPFKNGIFYLFCCLLLILKYQHQSGFDRYTKIKGFFRVPYLKIKKEPL